MDNKLSETRRKIRFLRAEMLGAEDNIRKQVNRGEGCAEAAVHLMAMRVVMLGLIAEWNRLGGEERLLNVDERPRAGSPRTGCLAAVSDDPVATLHRQIIELEAVARQLSQAGLNSARAQLLLSRKRAELEDFINRGQRCQHRSNGTTATRTTRHG